MTFEDAEGTSILAPADVRAAVDYATELLNQEHIFPFPPDIRISRSNVITQRSLRPLGEFDCVRAIAACAVGGIEAEGW